MSGYNFLGLTAKEMYNVEIGNATKTFVDSNGMSEIGLMYASDYGYSVKNSSCNHSSRSLLSYDKTACGGNAWMLKNGNEWTLSPNSSSASSVLFVISNAFVYSYNANNGFGVRPVLYLNSNVYITGGDGSINNPFQVGL